MKLSIIILTKDRPQLLEKSLKYIKLSASYFDEIIVSDTSTIHKFHNLEISQKSQIHNLKYIERPSKFSAVQHWNEAIVFASGDFVFCLTDKMILIPGVMENIKSVLIQNEPDVLNWSAINCSFLESDKILSTQTILSRTLNTSENHDEYNSIEILMLKAEAKIHRADMSPHYYASGKICFGGYSRALIDKMISKTGSVCSGATHDYSAMVKALCLSNKSIEIKTPAILHINLPVWESTGGRITSSSKYAHEYIQTLHEKQKILEGMLIPNLYTSVSNLVSYDYKMNLKFSNIQINLDSYNWFINIYRDLSSNQLVWESNAVKREQFLTYYKYIWGNLPARTFYKILFVNFKSKVMRFKTSLIVNFKSKLKLLMAEYLNDKNIKDIIETK